MLLGTAAVVAVVFWTATIADVIAVHEDDVVRMRKEYWLLLVMIVPVLGGAVWLRTGRGTHVAFPAVQPVRQVPRLFGR